MNLFVCLVSVPVDSGGPGQAMCDNCSTLYWTCAYLCTYCCESRIYGRLGLERGFQSKGEEKEWFLNEATVSSFTLS